MIKYHILTLLALAVVAIAGIEAAAEFYTAHLNPPHQWYNSGKGWLMAVVSLAAVVLYFRARSFRKRETMKSSHSK